MEVLLTSAVMQMVVSFSTQKEGKKRFCYTDAVVPVILIWLNEKLEDKPSAL